MEDLNEDSITFVDLVQEQDALERAALADIQENWGDEYCCTFHDGAISQPVFACLSCFGSSGRAVGVCFGCSMSCHVDHRIVELYEKRDFRYVFSSSLDGNVRNKQIVDGLLHPISYHLAFFVRCDCGTGTQRVQCLFEKNHILRSSLNQNDYNQNFLGLFCWCMQEYDGKATMYQCFLCQDWFHKKCLKKKLKESPTFFTKLFDSCSFSSFICPSCSSTRGSFLIPQYQCLLISPFQYESPVFVNGCLENVGTAAHADTAAPAPSTKIVFPPTSVAPAHSGDFRRSSTRTTSDTISVSLSTASTEIAVTTEDSSGLLNTTEVRETNQLCKRILSTWVDETWQPQHAAKKMDGEAKGEWICDMCGSEFSCHQAYRFRCQVCEDFDLCSVCREQRRHNKEHQEKIFLVDTHLLQAKKEVQGRFF